MRIGIVTAEYPPAIGGVGDHAARLAHELVALGQTVQVLTTGYKPPERRTTPPDGVQVLRAIERWDWRLLGVVRREAAREAWDVVHVQYQPAAYRLHGAITLLPRWLRRGRRRPAVVTTFHDLREPYLFPKAGALRSLAVRQLARGSHGAIAVAEEDLSQLTAWTRGRRHATVVEFVPLGNHFDAPPPADFDRAAWRASIGAQPQSFLLGHLGLVNRSKGIDALVRALHLSQGSGRDVRLLMIGDQLGTSDPTNATYLQDIKRLIESLGLEPFVRWTGYEPAPRVAAWLRCLDLAVLPFADGPTLRRTSLIGAWSNGVPVLTTRPQHDVEWLRDPPAAAVVPIAGVEPLARAIASLHDAPERRAALAEAGLAYSARFAWPEVARRTLALYRAARHLRDHGAAPT
jgi:glycosyltransferase involved in cell wall biosynthesis